jgi:cysteine synthase A
MRGVQELLGRKVGPSTGTNLWSAFGLIDEMARAGRRGSIVTLLCDGGERYADTYYDDGWVAAQGWDLGGPLESVRAFLRSGEWSGR